MKLSTKSYTELTEYFKQKLISKRAYDYIVNKYYQKINKPVDSY